MTDSIVALNSAYILAGLLVIFMAVIYILSKR